MVRAAASQQRSARAVPRRDQKRCKRHCACAATPGNDAGPDEDKAFQIESRNRRQSLEKDSGDSNNLLTALSELSKGRNKPNQTTTVLGADQMSWAEVNDAVYTYPCSRTFTAIGEGSDDFRDSMVASVENALGRKVDPEWVQTKPSRAGNYMSVRIGPMTIETQEEVSDIYQRMQNDGRMRWWM